MAGEREIVAYFLSEYFVNEQKKLTSPELFDTPEFNEFMSTSFPTFRMTKNQKEKILEHIGKMMERAIRPIATSLKSYTED